MYQCYENDWHTACIILNLSKLTLNYFERRLTNASAESFNAKVKAFRSQFRGVGDIRFFMFRLATLYSWFFLVPTGKIRWSQTFPTIHASWSNASTFMTLLLSPERKYGCLLWKNKGKSGIRESNPPFRLGKPAHYRYANPARRRKVLNNQTRNRCGSWCKRG